MSSHRGGQAAGSPAESADPGVVRCEPPAVWSPRIHRDLLEEQHERVSRKRVIRLMQEEGLRARTPKRFVGTTDSGHGWPVAANLLNREFTAA